MPIDDAEIAAIQASTQSGLVAEPWPILNVGERVQIQEGPLSGVEGILLEVKKKQRVIVSVSLLKRSMAIEIERHWARPLNHTGHELIVSANTSLATSALCI